MEITIQIRGRVFSICIGRHTKWFDQVWKLALIEEWYSNREVIYAKVIKTWFRKGGSK